LTYFWHFLLVFKKDLCKPARRRVWIMAGVPVAGFPTTAIRFYSTGGEIFSPSQWRWRLGMGQHIHSSGRGARPYR